MDKEVWEVTEIQAEKAGQIDQDLLARRVEPSEKEKPKLGWEADGKSWIGNFRRGARR